MKKFLFAALVSCLPFVLTAQELVRIASYNIKFLKETIGEERKRSLEKVLAELEADVIGLQEIDNRKALEKIFPPAQWHIVIDDDSNDDQDLAIVARKSFRIKGFATATLNADDQHFLFPDKIHNNFFPDRRDVLAVEIEVPNQGGSFYLMVHHAKARVGGRATTDARRAGASIELVRKIEKDFDEIDFILLGDFNDSPDDAALNILETGNPAMIAAMENTDDEFMVNLSEPLFADDHVSFGRNNSDKLPDNPEKISTTEPGIRQRNFDKRHTDDNVGDCLFDQILIPKRMLSKYMSGSFTIFNGTSAVVGNNTTRASDHLPVYADFLFGSDTQPVASATLVIERCLPNPTGDDTNNEIVVLKNTGSSTIDLSQWSLEDKAGNSHPLSGSVSGNTSLEIKLSGNKMPLNNSGDTIYLKNASGVIIHSVSYTATQVTEGQFVLF